MPRVVHYVGFRDDRYWNALRIWGGPRVFHRWWDRRAAREIAPEDVVIFAVGDWRQEPRRFNASEGNIYLTPHTQNIPREGSPASDSSGGAGAPEVTDAMIEAGIAALYRFNISEPTRPEMDNAVRATFRAMLLARR